MYIIPVVVLNINDQVVPQIHSVHETKNFEP